MTQPPLTSSDVAVLFGVTAETVKNWADGGRLPHFKTPGGHYRFRREDVEPLLASTSAAEDGAA